MQISFALIMQATSSTLVSSVTQDWLTTCADAVQTQLNENLSPEWGGSYAVRVSNGNDLAPSEVAFAIVDSLPNAPGAIAYHDVNGQDVPIAFLALSTCNSLDDVSTAISHECCETAGDWACNFWAEDGNGTEWALELCDAVESANYRGKNSILLSDFLLPEFFMPTDASGHYSFTGAAQAPFATAPGGYQITRPANDSGETQVQGDATGPKGKLAKGHLHHDTSRPAKRGLK